MQQAHEKYVDRSFCVFRISFFHLVACSFHFLFLVGFRFECLMFRFNDKVQMQPTSIYQALTEGKTKPNAHTEVVSCKYITVSFYFGISQNNS